MILTGYDAETFYKKVKYNQEHNIVDYHNKIKCGGYWRENNSWVSFNNFQNFIEGKFEYIEHAHIFATKYIKE